MKPQYVVVDETEYWCGSVRAMIGPKGKIKTSYLFDSECGTYLCEMTPSHHLLPIHTWAEPDTELSEEDSEWLDGAIIGEGSEVIYMHVSDVRDLKPQDVTPNFPDDTFEEVHQYCVANCGAFS